MVGASGEKDGHVRRGRLAASAAAIVAAGFVLYVAPATAIRPASHAEAEAIQRDLGLQACEWRVGISTLDTAWARIEADPAACAAVSSLNSHAHFDGARWIGMPWTVDIQGLCPAGAAIPETIAGDLGLCVGPAPPSALIGCDKPRMTTTGYHAEPRKCSLTARSQAYGQVVNLRALHWRNWGDRVALAWGAEGREPVEIRAWRLRRICGETTGARAYTRLRIASDRGVLDLSRAAC
jgi:hypothetical protein